MRTWLCLALLGAAPALAWGQTAGPSAPPGPRSLTAMAGWGNAMGWFGLQGEKYLRNDRISLFGGIGYTPELDDGASGATFAAGLRGYTPGFKHRGFLELSVSQLVIQQDCLPDCGRWYGPGLQAGYQFATRGGFTLLFSLGIGYAPGAPDEVGAMGGLGLGYTWRR